MEFWSRLLDTSDFPARWHCGRWTAGHGWLHILSDIGVWSAYFAIPCVLLYFIWRRQDLPFRRIFVLFAAFILLCGTTHLMEAIIFWWPAYRLAGVIKLLTAVVSWVTVGALAWTAPKVLLLKSPEQLEREVAKRTAELAAATSRLAAEREWFSTTLASIGDAVIATDTQGRVTMLNEVAEKLTGWNAKEAKDHPLSDVFRIVNEQTRQPVPNPALRALADGTIVGLANHTVLIAKDGKETFIDDSAAPIRDNSGNISGAVLVFRDITDRKKADAELRESEARFVQLADAIPQLVWMAGPDGHIDWYNNRWYEYTGTSYAQMEGWGWQSVQDPDVLPQVLARWKESLATGNPFNMTFPLRGADGEYRPFLTRVMPVKDDAGKVIRWFGTNTDISELQRLENELRQSAAELSEADRRKDEFLATLAHELRNPLAPIRTGLEVMKLAADDPSTFEEVRSTMERQTQQLITLVDDLLDVSRISRGKLELRKCRVKLADVLQSAVEASTPFINEAGHELTVTIPEPIIVDADPHRLAQVVSNLLSNAAKYTPEGGRISLSSEHQNGEVVISVCDNGIGIPTEMQTQIFEMFTQIDRPMEKGYTGLGIGLTLSKSLVDLHHGRIEVFSEGVNQGCEFRVRLPLPADTPAEEPQSRQLQLNTTHQLRRKILVVDDNKAAATLLSMSVKMLGCEVRTAGDGEEAIRVATEFRPDVILMDIGMPKMNGYDAARHLRQQPWGQKILLVALSGWGTTADQQRSQEAGFDHHLIKPADPSALQRLLTDFDSNSQASPEVQ